MCGRSPNASTESWTRWADCDALLYWTESFWPRIGGSEVAAMVLLEQLQLRGHEVEVVTRQWTDEHIASDAWRGIPIHRIPFDDWRARAPRSERSSSAWWSEWWRSSGGFVPI